LAVESRFQLIQHPDDSRLRLEGWRQNVGPPVALDASHSKDHHTTDTSALLVLSWNVWIGRGRLREVVSRIRNGDLRHLGAEPETPLVILLQEACRTDASLPAGGTGSVGRVLLAQRGSQEDVVETAQALGLSLRYAPSMRNGLLPSDRGNAILSSLPLEDAHAVELPLVLQRRVAVTAAASFGGRRLRLVSAHLDPRGPPGHRWLGAAGRELQARHLLSVLTDDTVILGADLNLGRGRYEAAWRLLNQAGFTFGVPPSTPRWRHTFHALPRLVLDYVLVRDPSGLIHRAQVHRVDEHPQDRGPRVFGSDHHPLLAQINFQPTSGASS
jgi:endonuclease/exonuclease/phosphatase family metal-dependent hydrolase